MLSDKPKNWRDLGKKHALRGATTKKCRVWIRHLYRTKKPGTPFTLREMMEGVGLDPDNVRDYSKASNFLMKEREIFKEVVELVLGGSSYAKYRTEGLDDYALYRRVVDNAIENNIYPVWSDPNDDHKYKLFDLPSFCTLTDRRMRALAKEVENKAPTMTLLRHKLPSVKSAYDAPQLSSPDGLLKLPGEIECEICHDVFDTQEAFAKHYSTHVTGNNFDESS